MVLSAPDHVIDEPANKFALAQIRTQLLLFYAQHAVMKLTFFLT